jgi:hypothetical protein
MLRIHGSSFDIPTFMLMQKKNFVDIFPFEIISITVLSFFRRKYDLIHLIKKS